MPTLTITYFPKIYHLILPLKYKNFHSHVGDDVDIYGGRIYSGRSSQRGVRRRKQPFIPKFYNNANGFFTIQRLLVVSDIINL